jgi:serine/threonine protein kinase
MTAPASSRYRACVDAVSSLETALGAELLRAELLGARRPRISERYIIERFLGRGATGVVVAATDERLGRPVALKLSTAAPNAANLEEARALARLDHPNVVRVLDAEVTDATIDGTDFQLRMISMQLVAGVSLRAWLDRKSVV